MMLSLKFEFIFFFTAKILVKDNDIFQKLPLKDRSFRMDHKRPELTLIWEATNERPEVTQVISIFTQVHCVLQADNQPLKWMVS